MAAEREEQFGVSQRPDVPQGADYGLEDSEVQVPEAVGRTYVERRIAAGGAVLAATMFVLLPRAAADDLVVVNNGEVGIIEGAESASGETPYSSTVDVGGEGRSVVVHESGVASVGVPSSGQIKTVDLADPGALAVSGTKPVSGALGRLAPRAGDDLMWVPFGTQLGVGNPDNPEIEAVSGGGPFPEVASVLNSSNERIVITSVGDSGTQFCILKETGQGTDEYDEVLILDLAEIVAELGAENFHFDPRGFASVAVSDDALVLQIGGVGGGAIVSFPFNPDNVDPANAAVSFDKTAGEIVAVSESSTFSYVVMSDYYQVGLGSNIVLVDPLTGQVRVIDILIGIVDSYVFDSEDQILYVAEGEDVYVIDLSSPDIDDVVSDNTGGNLQVINTAAFGDIKALGLRKVDPPEGDDDDDDDDDVPDDGPPDGFDEEDEIGDSELYAEGDPEFEYTESPTGLDAVITEMPGPGESIWSTYSSGPAAAPTHENTLTAEDAISPWQVDMGTEGTKITMGVETAGNGDAEGIIRIDSDQFENISECAVGATVYVDGEPLELDFQLVEDGVGGAAVEARFPLGNVHTDYRQGGETNDPDNPDPDDPGNQGCQASFSLPNGHSAHVNILPVLALIGAIGMRRRRGKAA